ncbi:MerR family transcriptional regulator [Actinomadura alba]
MSIGQVADRTGLSIHTLRFYEHEGILANPVHRDLGGRRVYSEDDVEWLTLCTVLRASGMPLPAIRQYTELVRQGAGNEEQRLTVLRHHHERVTAQMGRLSKSLDLISYKIRVYEDIVGHGAPGDRCNAPSRPPDADRADPG